MLQSTRTSVSTPLHPYGATSQKAPTSSPHPPNTPPRAHLHDPLPPRRLLSDSLSRRKLRCLPRSVVNTLPAYRLLVSIDRRVLRDVLVIGQGHCFNCPELHRIWWTARIALCENHKCVKRYMPLHLFFPRCQQLCMVCIIHIAGYDTEFHAFGIQKPGSPKLHHYGASTKTPGNVITLRVEYPYQTISVVPLSHAPLNHQGDDKFNTWGQDLMIKLAFCSSLFLHHELIHCVFVFIDIFKPLLLDLGAGLFSL